MFVILQTSLSCVTRRNVSNIDDPSSHVQEEETQFVVVLLQELKRDLASLMQKTLSRYVLT